MSGALIKHSTGAALASHEVCCDGVLDTHAGFQIYFRKRDCTSFFVISLSRPYAYRWIDEADSLKNEYLKDDSPLPSFCFDVVGSDLLNWFHQQSLGIRADKEIRAYLFSFENDVLELLLDESPCAVEIEFAEYQQFTGFPNSKGLGSH